MNAIVMPQHTISRAWIIWATGMAFVVFQFTLQLGSGVLIGQLAIDFKLSAFHAGIMSASYYYIYIVLQVPAGILADRFGARRILTIGSTACGLGCFIFAFAQSIAIAEAGRLLMGAGGALSFVGLLFLVQHWFPPARFAMMVGITETAGLLCTIGGDIYLADIITNWGWRSTMRSAGVISIFIAALCWLIIRDTPNRRTLLPAIDRHQFFTEIKNLMSSLTVWFNGIYCGLVYSVITVFVALWGVPFMILKYHVSLSLATTINVALFAGAALTCPIIGWIAQRWQCYRTLLLIGAFMPMLLMCLIIYTSHPYWVAALLLFFTGIFISPYVLNFAIGDRLSPDSSRSTCIGLTNGLCMITAPIFQVVVGCLLDYKHLSTGDLTIVGQYQLSDYHFALTTFPIILCCAGIIALFLKIPLEKSS